MLTKISGDGRDLAQSTIRELTGNGKPPSQPVVTSRHPEKLTTFMEQGIKVKKADFYDHDSVHEAFTGCDRVVQTMY